MKQYNIIQNISFFLLGILSLASCGSGSRKMEGMTYAESSKFIEAERQMQQIRQIIDTISIYTAENITALNEQNQLLVYDYDPAAIDSSAQDTCEKLQQQVKELHDQVEQIISTALPTLRIPIIYQTDHLMEETGTYPVYLKRGDSLFISITAEQNCSFKVYNEDSKVCLLSRSGKKQYEEKMAINNSAIYLLEVHPQKTQYMDVIATHSITDREQLSHPISVEVEQVEAQSKDWRAYSVKGIQMTSVFTEPKKFTLRGQLKAAFSGSYRAIVAIPVPQGASDILYSLRISTNETAESSDGQFHDNMETSYRSIKFLGLPIYESHKGAGIISTLLGENVPPREEDAYINMYVFYSSSQAKKFQDGADPAKLTYSVDYSTMGTQSCDGRIPAKGYQTIYLGFLNERMRYNNYVWLEAISAVPHTEYYKPKYTIVE